MNPMCDALAVLGSRHGLIFNPVQHRCGIVRFDRFDALPELHLRAGVRIGDQVRLLPLAPTQNGEAHFEFVDQRIGPASIRWVAIDGPLAVKVTLEAVVPFRTRDLEFSSTPVIGLRLKAEPLPGRFRWTAPVERPDEIQLFLEFTGPKLTTTPLADPAALALSFSSRRATQDEPDHESPKGTTRRLPDDWREQHDAVICTAGERTATGFRQLSPTTLEAYWCARPEPAFVVRQEPCPLWCETRFANVAAVAAWAQAHGSEVFDQAATLAAEIKAQGLSRAQERLLCYTLHSWLINTWLAWRPDGRTWFSVWEGNCYFHSTIDVEFTQAPYYLQHWPELLGVQLDEWAEFARNGEECLGSAGTGTRFFPHDIGRHSEANGQAYPHAMEVEETTNWLILLCAHTRRTGDATLVQRHGALVSDAVAFLKACDLDGTGVPVKGIANTIDDGSPAIQFGRAQVYLAVKTLAAYVAVLDMAEAAGLDAVQRDLCTQQAEKIRRAVDSQGWQGDHFGVLLERSGTLHNPWTGETKTYDEIPGWDGAHIYTCNAIIVLDLVGLDTGLDPAKLRRDLEVATRRCLGEYGCAHTDFAADSACPDLTPGGAGSQLIGTAPRPGWIAMNMVRDLAAKHRQIDFSRLADLYWDWQVTTNSQEPKIFFETFSGNNLSFYPRGLAYWGWLDATYAPGQ